MAAVSHALSTVTRIKTRLSISDSSFDTILGELLSAATGFIERRTSRRFKSTTYTSEVYSGDGDSRFLNLRQWPVTTLSALQYRAGTPDNPTWSNFSATDYELVNDLSPRRIRVYGNLPKGTNNIRTTYTAGYLIDFANETDTTKHTLPFDLSDLCERMVVKMFKRRESEGKASEASQEVNFSWEAVLNEDDKATLAFYRGSTF